jgi:hypothetical protein
MTPKIRLIVRPLLRYLNQPILNNQSVWQFSRFWYLYKIQFLESCLQKEMTSETHHSQ